VAIKPCGDNEIEELNPVHLDFAVQGIAIEKANSATAGSSPEVEIPFE